jgi:hypothetical protein
MKGYVTKSRALVVRALAAVLLACGLVPSALAAELSISGGTAVDFIPQGTSGNSVLAQAGIGFAGGQIWVDGTLHNQANNLTLTLYDVGSESEWKNQIRFTDSGNAQLKDNDDHTAGTSGNFTHGPAPFALVGSVHQNAGVTMFRFWRVKPDPDIKIVVNGQSPMMMVPTFGYASIALAYLNDDYQIVNDPTNRILVLLEDGGTDRDYDDYVGIVEAAPPGPPGPAILSISGGNATDSIPQGNSGNIVLEQAGIGMAGGQIFVDGTLSSLANDVTLTLYDVGSESHWRNEITLDNDSGKKLRDKDDFFRGSEGTFTHGPAPFALVGTVTQGSGVLDFEFWRKAPDPEYQIVVNGQSPMMMVPEYGFASIALAYLSDTNQIVTGPTNRVLIILEDGGTDRDYDDFVLILEASSP